MTTDQMTQEAEAEFKQEVFEYLDGLRESIEDDFGIERKEASALLLEWMATFGERHPQ